MNLHLIMVSQGNYVKREETESKNHKNYVSRISNNVCGVEPWITSADAATSTGFTSSRTVEETKN